jgi:hypothetical protein
MKPEPEPIYEDPHAPHGQPPVCTYVPREGEDEEEPVEAPTRR